MPTCSPDEAVITRLLSMPEAERSVFWRRACGADPGLAARWPHLDEDLLKRPVAAGALQQVLASALGGAERETESAGSRLGPYLLRERIGEGGFGVVWLADQAEPVRRRVALKIVKAGCDTDEVIARFEAERQALALMDHPNIAQVFDAGATAAGRPFFVMELVRGVAITQYCDENRLPVKARLRLFLQVCQAVQHAHQKGVIHRDLKPSNILVTLHDSVPVPKVIDFGIAKATGRKLTEKTLVTQLHAFIGTPAYTSPEQMERSGLDVDTRSDIYSLGVLLYELLTGRPPFEAATLLKLGFEAMCRRIRETEPLPPSAKLRSLGDAERATVAGTRGTDSGKLQAVLRGDLDWIALRCLEKDRTRRYQTAHDLAQDVSNHLQDRPVWARPPSRTYRLRKMLRRHRVGAALTTLALVLAAFGGLMAARARRADQVAKHRQAEIREIFGQALAIADPGYTRGRRATLEELLNATARRVPAIAADNSRLEADIRALMGETYIKLMLYENAAPQVERAWEIRRRLLAPDDPDRLRARRNLGALRVWQRRFADAEAALAEVLTTQERNAGRGSEEALLTRHEILFGRTVRLTITPRGVFPERDAFVTRSLHFAQESHELARHSLGETHPLTLLHRGNVGTMLGFGDTAQRREATEVLGENYQTCRSVLGAEHPITVGAAAAVGEIFVRDARFDQAAQWLQEHLGLIERVLGPDHGETLWAVQNLQMALRRVGRVEEANRLVPRYVDGWMRVYGLRTRAEATFALSQLNRWAWEHRCPHAAEQFALEHLAELRRRRDESSDSLAVGSMTLAVADARIAQGHCDEAEAPLREAAAILAQHKPEPEELWTVYSWQGYGYWKQRKYAEAEAALLTAYAGHLGGRESWMGPAPRHLRRTMTWLVEMYAEAGLPVKSAEWRARLEAFSRTPESQAWPDPEGGAQGPDWWPIRHDGP